MGMPGTIPPPPPHTAPASMRDGVRKRGKLQILLTNGRQARKNNAYLHEAAQGKENGTAYHQKLSRTYKFLYESTVTILLPQEDTR